jgi:hypothetical protein
LINEVFQLPILGSERVELVNVEFPELFDVDGSTGFVGSVVELGIVFVDGGTFWVVVAVAVYGRGLECGR